MQTFFFKKEDIITFSLRRINQLDSGEKLIPDEVHLNLFHYTDELNPDKTRMYLESYYNFLDDKGISYLLSQLPQGIGVFEFEAFLKCQKLEPYPLLLVRVKGTCFSEALGVEGLTQSLKVKTRRTGIGSFSFNFLYSTKEPTSLLTHPDKWVRDLTRKKIEKDRE